MGILPEKRSKADGPPPLVVYWREEIRASRVGRFLGRHKTASAVAAALYAVAKGWKWVIFDVWRWGTHPGATLHWAVHHAAIAAGVSVVVFVVAFAVSRFGLDWLVPDKDETPLRPPDRHRNAHAQTHIPGGV